MQFTIEEHKLLDPASVTCCPNCKQEFVIPDPDCVRIGEWAVSKNSLVYQQTPVILTKQQYEIFYHIAKSPRPLLVDRLGYLVAGEEVLDYRNLVAVQVSRARTRLRVLGIECPIQLTRSCGYSWKKPSTI